MTIWTDFQGGGVKERYTRPNGIRTRVIEAGERGEPLFLLHGTGGHAEAFCRNIVPLSRARRVMAPDLIGHGFSDHPDIDYDLDAYADHLLGLADEAGVEKVDVTGGSIGGLAAAWFAVKHPDRIGRLALSTTLLKLPDESGMAGIRRALELADAMKEEMTMATVRDRMQWLVEDPSDMTEELVAARYRIYTQPGMGPVVDRTVRMLLGWLAGDESGEKYVGDGVMEQIECPTMIVWTPDKPIWSVEQARAMAKEMPDARIEELTGGHWPQFERPDQWNALHRDFFSVG